MKFTLSRIFEQLLKMSEPSATAPLRLMLVLALQVKDVNYSRDLVGTPILTTAIIEVCNNNNSGVKQ